MMPHVGPMIRQYNIYSIQLKKKKYLKTKEEEAENNYRMGLWHFTPFLNKRAPN
jgi:hypothetical protein